MKTHPACDLFPMLTGEGLEELADDIRRYGQQVPCVRDGDMIIDGRNRHAACQQIGIETKWVEFRDVVQKRGIPYEGEDLYPIHTEYILSTNLMRRQLTSDQMASIGSKSIPIYRAEAEERKKAKQFQEGEDFNRNTTSGPKKLVRAKTHEPAKRDYSKENANSTIARVAKVANVSPYKIRQATKVQNADPELAAKVAAGEVSLNDAVKQVEQRAGLVEEKPKDEPWLDVWKRFCKLDQDQKLKFWSHGENHYRPQSEDDQLDEENRHAATTNLHH